MGFVEILMLLILSGGGTNTDLAALLPAQSYFQSRGIDISIDKAAALAAKDPVDGKTQIAQLVALRYLAEESAKLKGAPDYAQHRRLLTAIAVGKQAQDPQGFAKEYAAQVLAKLDGVKPLAVTAPSPRDDSFLWFPANASLLGAFDARLARGATAPKSNLVEMFKLFPPKILNTTYDVVEKIGNVRIDRIAFAYVDGPKDQHMGEIYIRITGKANPAWLLDGLREQKMSTKTSKGPAGETVTKVFMQNQAPGVFLMIGDSEIVIAGYQKVQADHEGLLDKVLQRRDGKLEHASAGLLKGELAKIPAKACGLLVGTLPAETSMGTPFPIPVMISGHILRAPNALDVNLAGSMANGDDAIQLVKALSQIRQQGIDGLKQFQGAPMQLPGLEIGPMIQMLESLQVEAQGSTTNMRLLLPDDTMSGAAMLLGVGARAFSRPPPPVKE
jgi:hypothetical protein